MVDHVHPHGDHDDHGAGKHAQQENEGDENARHQQPGAEQNQSECNRVNQREALTVIFVLTRFRLREPVP